LQQPFAIILTSSNERKDIMNTQVIYYSKYGSTREIAEAIGRKLGTGDVRDVRELKKIDGDLIVVGSAIYEEVPHKGIVSLLKDADGRLKEKQVALFVVCLAKERRTARNVEIGGPVYLEKMEGALGRPPVAGKIFGGRMIIAEMEEKERKMTEAFYKEEGLPFVDKDIMSESEVDEFVYEIRARLEL
jgi:menaquinone-dependent protoporphyrinogen IX oxidase